MRTACVSPTFTGRTGPGAAVLLVAAALPPASGPAQSATDIHLLALETRDGRIAVTGEPATVTDRAGYDNQPSFTPEGLLLYTSIRDGQADTYRHDPATGRTTRVTATPESEYSPTPIPGSDRFSVVRVEADSTQRLWSFAPDGTRPRRVLEVEPVGYHAWAGDRVALFVLGEPATLRLADPATARVRVMARSIGRSLQSVPGRDAISFTQSTDDGWRLRLLDLGTGAIETVAPLLGPDEYHAWTPDGGLLTAHGTEVFQLDEASWRPVADVARWGLGPVTRLAVSGDGRTLAIVADRPIE